MRSRRIVEDESAAALLNNGYHGAVNGIRAITLGNFKAKTFL